MLLKIWGCLEKAYKTLTASTSDAQHMVHEKEQRDKFIGQNSLGEVINKQAAVVPPDIWGAEEGIYLAIRIGKGRGRS